jgi:hypothetical protein
MPGKTPITLKQEVAEFLASNNVGSRAFVLDDKDVVLLFLVPLSTTSMSQ